MLLQKNISLHSLMTIITALKDKESKYYNLSLWNKETELQRGCSLFRETPCPMSSLLYTVQRFFFSPLYLDLGCFGRNSSHSVRLCASVVSDSLWPQGFSRQEYWKGLPFSPLGDLPDPGIEPTSPAILYHWATWKAPNCHFMIIWRTHFR